MVIKVIGVSANLQLSHHAWCSTDPKDSGIKYGGIGAVNFPLVADLTKKQC